MENLQVIQCAFIYFSVLHLSGRGDNLFQLSVAIIKAEWFVKAEPMAQSCQGQCAPGFGLQRGKTSQGSSQEYGN